MRTLFTLFSLAVALGAGAQKAVPVHIYTYMQPSHPGIVPANVRNATLADYQVYIVHPAFGFRITGVQVEGKSYGFYTESLSAPVSYVNRNLPQHPKTVTLVPATKGKVERIYLKGGPTKPGAGALTINYVQNGKKYTKTVKTWIELEPVMHQ